MLDILIEYFEDRRMAVVHTYELIQVLFKIFSCMVVVCMFIADVFIYDCNARAVIVTLCIEVLILLTDIHLRKTIDYFYSLNLSYTDYNETWIYEYVGPNGYNVVRIPISSIINVKKRLDDFVLIGSFYSYVDDCRWVLVNKVVVPDLVEDAKYLYEDAKAEVNFNEK